MIEWISVKDRLPDSSGKYLGFCERGMIEVEFSMKGFNFEVTYFNSMGCGCCAEDDVITHWMPLPEPPK